MEQGIYYMMIFCGFMFIVLVALFFYFLAKPSKHNSNISKNTNNKVQATYNNNRKGVVIDPKVGSFEVEEVQKMVNKEGENICKVNITNIQATSKGYAKISIVRHLTISCTDLSSYDHSCNGWIKESLITWPTNQVASDRNNKLSKVG